MNALFAVARDSFREATDRKISSIMFVISAVFGLFLLSFGIVERSVETLVERAAKEAGYPRSARVVRAGERAVDLRLVRPAARAPGEAAAYDHYAFEVGEEPSTGPRHGDPARPSGASLSLAAERVRAMLEKRGVAKVQVESPGGPFKPEEPRMRLTLDYDPLRVRGATDLSVGFGLSEVELDREIEIDRRTRTSQFFGFSALEILLVLEGVLVQFFAGWAGLILVVVATAGFVPSMLAGGTAHLLLAKPVRRPTLLLGKYVGGVAFVAVHALVLVSVASVALWLRTGFFDGRLFMAPVALAGTFAILYSASVLAGVLFETPVVSVLAALFLWLLCWSAGQSREFIYNQEIMPVEQKIDIPEKLKKGIEVYYLVLPKPRDIGHLLDAYMSEDRVTADIAKAGEDFRRHIDARVVIGTSAAFTVALVVVACWVFQRRDY